MADKLTASYARAISGMSPRLASNVVITDQLAISGEQAGHAAAAPAKVSHPRSGQQRAGHSSLAQIGQADSIETEAESAAHSQPESNWGKPCGNSYNAGDAC